MEESKQQPDARSAEARPLGQVRWVQFSYLVAGLGLAWLLQLGGTAVWDLFAQPNEQAIIGLSTVAGLGAALFTYRNPSLNKASTEVASELSKVTWPTRQETRNATKVVILTSIVAALLLFVLDMTWSALSDIIYDA